MRPTAAAALVLTFAATCTASAQTAPPSPNQTVTIRGCVAPAQRDGSQEARSTGTTATPATAPDEANSGEFVNAYLLNDATLVGGGRADTPAAGGTYVSKPTSYTLQGLESELAKHKGHRVEVVGTVQQATKAGRGAGNKATAEGIQRVKISSVKMIGPTCTAQR
jgi:hypothetical protein